MAKNSIVLDDSVIHYLNKEGSYAAYSLHNLISAQIDPDGYVMLCFDKVNSEAADGATRAYFKPNNAQELVDSLHIFIKKKRIKVTFDKLLIAEPFTPIETLMAKADSIIKLLYEKKMENC